MKTQSTGQDPLKVNPTLHRRGGLWALFIVNLVCEAVAPAGREGRKEGRQLAGEAKRALTWARGGRRMGSPHPEAARPGGWPQQWLLLEVERRPSPVCVQPLGKTGTEKQGIGDPAGAWVGGGVGSRAGWGGGGPGGPGVKRGQSAMIFQFGWLNRVRAERGAEGTPCPAARAPSLEDNRGRGRAGPAGAGVCGAPARARSEAAGQLGRGGSAPGGAARAGRGVGGRSFPKCRCEGAGEGRRGRQEMWGRVRREKKKNPQKIYMGEMNFFLH